MKTGIFKVFLVTILLGFTFTACDKDEETWRSATLDSELQPGITNNGSFRVGSTIYVNDINGGSYRDIYDINLRDAKINLGTSDPAGFSYGDEIYIDDITINGQTFVLDYYVRIDSDLVGSKNVSLKKDYRYMDFMHEAMRLLLNRGRIDVEMHGSSNMGYGTLYIDLLNDLDILIDD